MNEELLAASDRLLNAVNLVYSNWDHLTYDEQDLAQAVYGQTKSFDIAMAQGNAENEDLLKIAEDLMSQILPVHRRIKELLKSRRETEESAGPDHLP